MKQSIRSTISMLLTVALLGNYVPVWAATGIVLANHVVPKPQTTVGGRVSDRLIVKFKPGSQLQGMSAKQVNAQLMQPLSAGVIVQLQAAANASLSESHAISNGAHVLSFAGQPDRQAMDNAIAGIRNLPNVEYVEEDRILTAQGAAVLPNDSMYLTVHSGPNTYPGLWGMWPVTSSAASAVGNPSSYGGDFQDAWGISTGAGVVVAVVDTGITPNIDIVGSSQTVAAGSGSNLISVGYDFISDCRIRGVTSTDGCAAGTTIATTRTPTPDATDTGDYITSADVSANPGLFPAPAPSSWHGTIVSGIIAALGNNNFGVIGGAYNAKILPVRVLGKGGGYESDIADGIMWAAGLAVSGATTNPNPAKVINLSLGGTGSCISTMQNAIDAAVAAGAVVVVAAGNEYASALSSPANCNNVISVVAIGRDGARASYSNYSTVATLAAPGGEFSGVAATYDPGVWSTANAGTTTQDNTTSGHSTFVGAYGTSMSAPHVSAAAALIAAKNASLSPAQIKNILSGSASLTAFPSFTPTSSLDCASNNNCGAGILNAMLAVHNSYVLAADVVPVDFGSVTSGGTATKTVTWTNVTAGTVTVSGSASITGVNSSFFTITSSNCDATTIAPAGTCAVTMTYAPTSSGSHSALLIVPSATLTSGVSLVGTLPAPAPSGGGGGGGGCSIMPSGANPDVSLLLAMLAVGGYWLRRRVIIARGEA